MEIVSVIYPTESGPTEFETWIRDFGNYSNIFIKTMANITTTERKKML